LGDWHCASYRRQTRIVAPKWASEFEFNAGRH
jgi:hypothetical protein